MLLFAPESIDYDMLPVGEPTGGGLARILPQGLFGHALERLNEVEEIDFHHIRPPRLHPTDVTVYPTLSVPVGAMNSYRLSHSGSARWKLNSS
jgi:hypothetical protein